jgi:ferritin
MRITETMEDAFNGQLDLELQATHNYLAMAAWLEGNGFPGTARWMQAQSDEERAHALRIYQFILDRGGKVRLGALESPQHGFDSMLAVFEAGLAQERGVSAAINRLYGLATEQKDFASVPLLDWFVNEQIEEEATFSQIIDDLSRAEGSPQALLLLDRELGSRTSA